MITNEELQRITHQQSIENQIKRRNWNWIEQTLCNETEITEKTALDWNPQGYRRRGRPKSTWRRTLEDEIRSSTRRSSNEVKGIAGDHNAWKLFTDALCSTRVKGFDDDDKDDRMMHGMNNNKLVSCQLFDHPAFIIAKWFFLYSVVIHGV